MPTLNMDGAPVLDGQKETAASVMTVVSADETALPQNQRGWS